jgi:hypothetical protein
LLRDSVDHLTGERDRFGWPDGHGFGAEAQRPAKGFTIIKRKGSLSAAVGQGVDPLP